MCAVTTCKAALVHNLRDNLARTTSDHGILDPPVCRSQLLFQVYCVGRAAPASRVSRARPTRIVRHKDALMPSSRLLCHSSSSVRYIRVLVTTLRCTLRCHCRHHTSAAACCAVRAVSACARRCCNKKADRKLPHTHGSDASATYLERSAHYCAFVRARRRVFPVRVFSARASPLFRLLTDIV